MRTVHTDKIKEAVKEMCIEANLFLSKDVEDRICHAEAEETTELGKKILSQLKENMEIAKAESIPICQDTGMAIIFLEIGQEVYFEGEYLEDAIALYPEEETYHNVQIFEVLDFGEHITIEDPHPVME